MDGIIKRLFRWPTVKQRILFQQNSSDNGTSTNSLRQRMMDYLIRTERTGDIHIYPAQGTFDAQAYEAEEEVDQYLSDSSHLGSVSAPSSRLNPQPSTIRSEVPSRVIYGDFESGMQSAFSYPSGWRDRDYTQYNVLVPIMTGQGIAYQAVEEECDACRSYFFSQTRQMTDNAYRTSRHLRDSQ